ncbi:hypothetical protein K456DRAFT_507646 [Colletotrichum gloeosporioides 23]|nr:hypothetical protein K456DRAFT_507646 [Colletotrichum gloeosporioides 23]
MTTSRHQRSQQRLVQLLFLASASTAAIISIGGTDLTLSNFQLLTQLSIPLGCLLTYNNPIQGCTANDFSSTGTCSASCRRGLLLMQTNIQDVCQSVSVQANTVLGQALAGNLLGLLCSSNQVTTTSAAPTARPTSTVIVPPPSSTPRRLHQYLHHRQLNRPLFLRPARCRHQVTSTTSNAAAPQSTSAETTNLHAILLGFIHHFCFNFGRNLVS